MTGVTKLATQTDRGPELSWKGVTVGLDLSDKFTSLRFIDEAGEIVEEGRVRSIEAALGSVSVPYRPAEPSSRSGPTRRG